jgi:hypothetical protein
MQPLLHIFSHMTPSNPSPPSRRPAARARGGGTIAPMPPRTSRARRLAGLLASAAAVAAPLSGCGGSSAPTKGPDPARAVPASAALYAAATVRPAGALQSNARAVGRALTSQTDPYLRLLGALQTPGSAALDFKRDVSPWLGTQAGVFVSGGSAGARAAAASLLSSLAQSILAGSGQISFPFASRAASAAGSPSAQGALVLDTTNSRAASAFLRAQASRAGARAISYRGVGFEASGEGLAFGLVRGFAVIGTESAMRAVIEATAGGSSLASAAAYAKLRAAAPGGELAHIYLAGEGVSGASSGASGAAGGARGPSGGATGASGATGGSSGGLLSLLAGAAPADVSLIPAAGAIAVDADSVTSAARPGLVGGDGEAARFVAELPGESFVAAGLGAGAASIGRFVRAVSSAASLGPRPATETQALGGGIKGLLGAALAPVALMTEDSASARRDFQGWLGSGAIFASGSGLADLRAGLVIASRNPALSRAAVAKLAARLSAAGDSVSPASIPGTDAAVSVKEGGLPVALDIADGRDSRGQTKFVIGVGEASVAAVLNPPSTLSAAASYAAAGAQLGEGIQPSLVVQVPTLLSLLEGVGLAEDPTIRSLVPFARALTTVSAGAKSMGGGVERTRLVAALRGA